MYVSRNALRNFNIKNWDFKTECTYIQKGYPTLRSSSKSSNGSGNSLRTILESCYIFARGANIEEKRYRSRQTHLAQMLGRIVRPMSLFWSELLATKVFFFFETNTETIYVGEVKYEASDLDNCINLLVEDAQQLGIKIEVQYGE